MWISLLCNITERRSSVHTDKNIRQNEFFAMTIEYVSGNSNPLCYVTAHWRLNCPCNDTNNTSRCSREGYESRRIFQMNVFLSSLPSAASIRLITFVRLSTPSCFFLFRGRFHVEMQFTSCLSVTV